MIHPTGNHLLETLGEADRASLAPHLTTRAFGVGKNIETPGATIERVLFPDSGIVSVVIIGGDHRIEAGLIGYEGMTGMPLVMGDDRSPNETYIQVAGAGRWIEARLLSGVLERCPDIRRHFLLYGQAFAIQVQQTALANGRAHLDARLARWLMMAEDRHGLELPLTHEFLALMLGVRRAGVTDALNLLEGGGLIRAKRGLIVIRDRPGLAILADGFYGLPEACYTRLLGELASDRAPKTTIGTA